MKKSLYILLPLIFIITFLILPTEKQISTNITIDAPIHKVWTELIDFQKYPQWNPFIKKVTGDIKEGNTIEVTFQLHNSAPVIFTPKIMKHEENKIFQWEGKLLIPGIFTGRHTFKLQKIEDDKTKLIQKENFNGILVPFFNFTSTIEGFNLMNKALKKRIENKL